MADDPERADAQGRRPSAGVAGDGLHRIAQLVQRMREEPAYIRLSAERGHDPIVFDAEGRDLLAQEGMNAETVAADGQFVVLRRHANVSASGTPALVRRGESQTTSASG